MSADRPAGDFGRKLREARERRGISLRQIASATKISMSALEALEHNDISRLPGGIFSRAFVRSYAIEVGLDPETTIQEFVGQFAHDSITAGHPLSDQVEDHVAVESERRMASTFLRLLLVSVPIAIAVVYFGTPGRFARAERSPEGPATAGAPADASRANAPAATPTDREASAPAERPDTAVAPPASAPASPPPAASPSAPQGPHLTVGLTVTRPCWVSAIVDGNTKVQRLLQPGDDQTLEVSRDLVLTAGDAAAIAMTLNGAPARPLGGAGEVVTKRVNLTNFKDLLQPQ